MATEPRYSYDPVTQRYTLIDPMAPVPPANQGLGALYNAGGSGFEDTTPISPAGPVGVGGLQAEIGHFGAAYGNTPLPGSMVAGFVGNALRDDIIDQEEAVDKGLKDIAAAGQRSFYGGPGLASGQVTAMAPIDTIDVNTGTKISTVANPMGPGITSIAPTQTANLQAMNAQAAAQQNAQAQQAQVASTAQSVAQSLGFSAEDVADFADTTDKEAGATVGTTDGGGGSTTDTGGGGGAGGTAGAGDESSHDADGNNSGSGDYRHGGRVMNYQQGGVASLAQKVQSEGRGGDRVLVHMTPKEVAGLQALAMQHGGSLTINPRTGLVEAGFLSSILPMVAGAALAATGVGAPLAAGLVGGASYLMNPKQGLMGGLMAGLSAYGGAGLGAALAGPGAIGSTAMETAAMENVYMDPATKVMRPEFAAMGQDAQAQAILSAQQKAAEQYAQQGIMDRLSQSAGAIAKQPFDVTVNQLGGPMAALKTVGPAVATTALAATGSEKEDSGKPPYEAKIRPFTYDPGRKTEEPGFKYRTGERGESTAEQTYFASRFTPLGVYKPGQEPTYGTYAGGGITALKHGGMEEGGYVVAADVVSHLGNGSTKAGQELLSRKMGGVPLNGKGDGMSDSIPTHIEGKQRARVADGEVYIPASIAKGRAKDLDRMMKRIRKAKTGRSSQAPEMNTSKFVPA